MPIMKGNKLVELREEVLLDGIVSLVTIMYPKNDELCASILD